MYIYAYARLFSYSLLHSITLTWNTMVSILVAWVMILFFLTAVILKSSVCLHSPCYQVICCSLGFLSSVFPFWLGPGKEYGNIPANSGTVPQGSPSTGTRDPSQIWGLWVMFWPPAVLLLCESHSLVSATSFFLFSFLYLNCKRSTTWSRNLLFFGVQFDTIFPSCWILCWTWRDLSVVVLYFIEI